jgi:predicted nuclease of predicted toxin-antitoxin system
MKGYILDGNVPSRIRFSPKLPIVALSKVGPNPSDSQLWRFAKEHDLVIVSKDADFSDRIVTKTPPPRVVHLRFGNLRKQDFHEILARQRPLVETLLKSHKLVNVHPDRVEGIG